MLGRNFASYSSNPLSCIIPIPYPPLTSHYRVNAPVIRVMHWSLLSASSVYAIRFPLDPDWNDVPARELRRAFYSGCRVSSSVEARYCESPSNSEAIATITVADAEIRRQWNDNVEQLQSSPLRIPSKLFIDRDMIITSPRNNVAL